MTLADAVERFCQQPIDPERFAYRKTTRWRDPSKLKAADDELVLRIEEFDAAVTLCDEILTLLDELNGLLDDPTRFNRRLVRVDELRTRVSQESRAYRIVNAAMQTAELRRFSADRRISAQQTSDTDRARRQIERDIEFITSVRDGTKEVKPFLIEARRRIKRAMANE